MTMASHTPKHRTLQRIAELVAAAEPASGLLFSAATSSHALGRSCTAPAAAGALSSSVDKLRTRRPVSAPGGPSDLRSSRARLVRGGADTSPMLRTTSTVDLRQTTGSALS